MGRTLPIALATLALLSGCPATPVAPPPQAPASAVAAAPLAQARWLVVKPSQGVSLLEAPAQVLVAPDARAEVAPSFRARVVGISVRPGQRVKAGDAVASVLMPEVTRSAGSYVGATLRLEAYERRRQQLLSLRAEGLMRLADLAETEGQLAEAKAAQQEALATLRAAGIGGGEAAGLLSGGGQVTLRSPLAGVVTAVSGSLGQSWEPGAAALAQIVGSGETRIEARLNLQLSQPELFAAARFVLRVPTGARYPLRLLERAPIVDSRDGTTLAWLVPQPAADGSLPSLPFGLSGKVELLPGISATGGSDGRLVVVAAQALWLQPERTVVLRRRLGQASDGKPGQAGVESVTVLVLSANSTEALVRGPLAVGDELLAEPSLHEPLPSDGAGR